MEIWSLIAGICLSTRLNHAGQHDVARYPSPFSFFSISSLASRSAVIFAPSATSTTSVKPTAFIAFLICSKLPSNCPSIAGAIIPTTFSPLWSIFPTGMRPLLFAIAPNGQDLRQRPQPIHLSELI